VIFDQNFFKNICEETEIEPEIVMAIATVESGLDPNTVRYEPNWRYHFQCSRFAKKLNITKETEETLQSISWGLMQVMGTVARELGFTKHLTELTNPVNNVLIALRKLEDLYRIHDSTSHVISAYNQGWPYKTAYNEFVNQAYVDKVLEAYKSLK
jgi:soluble lytic murein transglycosylase-like protein